VLGAGRAARRGAALVAVAASVLATSAHAETRTPAAWPFHASSPWNTPLGSGAQYGSPACDDAVQAETANSLPPWINSEQYSFPIFPASGSNPKKTVYRSARPLLPLPHGESQGSYAIPLSAQPARGTDRSLIVQEPGGRFDNEMWRTYLYPTWVNVGGFSRHDLVNGDGFAPMHGFGIRAGNASALGGLIRTWELRAGGIRHALAVSLTQQRMTPSAVPPASHIDRDHRGYTGTIPMGQLFAIPQDTSIAELGLTSAAGHAIAAALQTYGAYVVDTSKAFAFYSEPDAEAHIEAARAGGTPADSDVAKIVGAMRCVTNNQGPGWGGGGTPLAPPAPPFG
jgi:hypothetical protein